MENKKILKIKDAFFKIPIALVLIILALLVLIPVVWMVFSAFKPEKEIISWPPTFIPKSLTLENFTDVQNRIDIIKYIANSVIYAGGTTALAVVVNSMAGYAYAFYDFKGKNGAFIMTLVTIIGHSRSFHEPFTLKIISVIIAGLTCGSIILQNIPYSERPSILAASAISFGIPVKAALIINIDPATATLGIISPQYESYIPIL